MTALTCEWCGRPFTRRSNRGPVPRYCSAAHRQRAFEKRWGFVSPTEMRARTVNGRTD